MRLAALSAAAGIAAIACGSTTSNNNTGQAAPASQQIYRVNSGTEPNSWDPGQQTYTYEANVGRNVFAPLLRPKQDLSDVEGYTADSYTVSSDGLTYTFHIRSNAKWSDGQPVKAADFVYGWKRLLNPALAAGYVDPFFDGSVAGGQDYANTSATDANAINAFEGKLGLAAPDASHFVVTLQHPEPYFKWVATLWVGAPIRQDVVDKAAGGSEPAVTDTTKLEAWAQTPTNVVGNGPFMISAEVPKDHVDLVPNPNAWDKPTLQKLSYYFIGDANQAFAKYQTGELDQIGVPLADTKTVEGDSKYKNQLLKINTLSPFWITFNDQQAPTNNPMVRKALTESIDRNQLCVDVDQGQCTALQGVFPKGFPLYDANEGASIKYDPAQAKKDLAASGVSTADLNKLKLLTRNTTGNITRNTFLVQQWNTNLGLNISLDTIDSKTVTRNIRKANFSIYFADGWGFDYPDAQDLMDIFTTGACHSLNFGCWNNSQYDSLVSKADQESNAATRKTDYQQAQNLLIQEVAVGPMFQSLEIDLVKPYIHILYTNQDDENTPGDFYYDQAYVIKH